MKAHSWAHSPYMPIRDPERAARPYICRLAPYKDRFSFEWFDPLPGHSHRVEWRSVGSSAWQSAPLSDSFATVEGLTENTDYEFRLVRDDGSASLPRLVNTFDISDYVVNYNHPQDDHYAFSGHYLSSPGILRLPSGSLLLSHDVFGDGAKQGLTILYRSYDRGASWHFVTEIYPLFWPKFFLHRNRLYTIGCARQGGDLIISVSDDEGASWREPVTLFYGDNGLCGNHQSCTPVIEQNGRLYTAFESGAWGNWNDAAFGSILMSAPCDCDLLDRRNWDFTPPAYMDRTLFTTRYPDYPPLELVTHIEGNAVPGPNGKVYNLLRIDPVSHEPRKSPCNLAMLTEFVDFDHPLEFVRMVHAKVGIRHKFFIKRDPQTEYYFMVHNEEQEKNLGRRCIISLSASQDLTNWKKLATLLDFTHLLDGGYSYPSFDFDGDDIIYVSRTAAGKRKSEHDNNYITFHRLQNFRSLLP